MRRIIRGTTFALAAGLLLTPAVHGQQADREQIVDIEKLNRVITRATESIAEPLSETRLSRRFTRVNDLLTAEELDKVALVRALRRLANELDDFVDRLDTGPIFEAEMQVGDTIDRIRMVMAAGPIGEPRAHIRAQVVEHERQLRELVAAIDAEPDPRRVKRLKLIFAHHLRLMRLKEQMGSVDLSDTRMKVLAKTAQSLDSLSTQLVSAAFRAEEARMVMGEQSRFLLSYIEILKGVMDAEEIAGVLSGLGGTGSKLSAVIGELTIVAAQAAEFGQHMDALSLRLTDQIEVFGENIATQVDRADTGLDMDIEKELARYRTKKK